MPFVIDKFKSKNRASVSEEFPLFNRSSVGYMFLTKQLIRISSGFYTVCKKIFLLEYN